MSNNTLYSFWYSWVSGMFPFSVRHPWLREWRFAAVHSSSLLSPYCHLPRLEVTLLIAWTIRSSSGINSLLPLPLSKSPLWFALIFNLFHRLPPQPTEEFPFCSTPKCGAPQDVFCNIHHFPISTMSPYRLHSLLDISALIRLERLSVDRIDKKTQLKGFRMFDTACPVSPYSKISPNFLILLVSKGMVCVTDTAAPEVGGENINHYRDYCKQPRKISRGTSRFC